MTLSRQSLAILWGITLGAGAVWLSMEVGWRLGLLWVVAIALGLSLLHASYGFTTAWRALLLDGRGAGVRAQMLMLGVGSVFAISFGEVWQAL